MKILFAMSSPEYLRFYDGVVAELAARGHDVVIAANHVKEGKPVRFERYTSDRVVIGGVIPPRGDVWTELARSVRGTMDFVRYLHPRLADASALRARMKRQALPLALQWVDRVHALRPASVTRVMGALADAERAIPVAAPVDRFLETHKPDVVLVSPLVEAASEQVDLVRAAMARGIRVGTCVASWDNLTNKGDLRIATDAVFVWNEAQKSEAVEFHRVPAERVVVTGSQVFDRWFDRVPRRPRDVFCGEVGLPSTAPFVLFTGSSIFIARAEVEVPFIRRWIQALRSAGDSAVRDLGVLVRPHPYNGQAWDPHALADLPGVAVWPRGGYDPVDDQNRAGFFDSMYHSEAVVGINTSAMIESAIVGRPVLSILAPEFTGSQEGTLHFHHLLPENGGFLRVAAGLDEHVRQLAGVLSDPAGARAELSRFVASFIRPHGIDQPATPILVGSIERFGRMPAPAPVADTVTARLLRILLFPLAFAAMLLPDEVLRKRRPHRWVREKAKKFRRARERKAKRAAALEQAAGADPRREEAARREQTARRKETARREATARHEEATQPDEATQRAETARHAETAVYRATAGRAEAVNPTGTPLQTEAVVGQRAASGVRRRMNGLVALLLMLPCVLATLAVLIFVGAETMGSDLFSYEPPSNVAEAAGMGLGAEVIRFQRLGQDPRAVTSVRPDIISSSVTRVTALEAAIWSRRVQLVRMLERDGLIDDTTRAHLACLAGDIRVPSIAAVLARPDQPPCDPGAAAAAVEARSR